VLAAGLAVAGTLAVVSLLGGDVDRRSNARVYTAPGKAFAIAHPASWRALPPSQLRGVPGAPALVLRSSDRKATIVVRRSAAPADQPLSNLATQLTAELKKRFADFKPVAARVAQTRGGAGFLYTFARPKAGLVQSILVARAGRRIYSLYATAPAADPAIAREAGQILGTFGQAKG
jgi:hypothetical protein